MKLHKNHLSDSFGQDYVRRTDSQLSSRIRECSEISYNIMIDISLQILDFAQTLELRILMSGVDKMSPLVLHCLSYLHGATGEDKFLTGRSVCDGVLKTMSLRWKAAGMNQSDHIVCPDPY
jgi:hypothetical protein